MVYENKRDWAHKLLYSSYLLTSTFKADYRIINRYSTINKYFLKHECQTGNKQTDQNSNTANFRSRITKIWIASVAIQTLQILLISETDRLRHNIASVHHTTSNARRTAPSDVFVAMHIWNTPSDNLLFCIASRLTNSDEFHALLGNEAGDGVHDGAAALFRTVDLGVCEGKEAVTACGALAGVASVALEGGSCNERYGR